MAQLVPTDNMFSLLSMVEAIKTEPFAPEEAVPSLPILLVGGERDELAETLMELARGHHGSDAHVRVHFLPARTHANAVTSRACKQAAVEIING